MVRIEDYLFPEAEFDLVVHVINVAGFQAIEADLEAFDKVSTASATCLVLGYGSSSFRLKLNNTRGAVL